MSKFDTLRVSFFDKSLLFIYNHIELSTNNNQGSWE